jgi:asparagine synthetase B (glutamine-hydrolysing)
MGGFALIFDPHESPAVSAQGWTDFMEAIAHYKHLDKPAQWVTGMYCLAAKFDAPATLHRGIVQDDKTGSWLLAVGTVIDQTGIPPEGDLRSLLTDYLEQGAQVFNRLDGHFVLVIGDGRTGHVLIVADPFGFISVFYGQRGGQWVVSTSALAVAQAVQSKPDELATRYLLMRGVMVGEMTLWRSVKRLLPATVLTLTADGERRQTYWSFELDQTVARLSLDESVDCVIDVLARTMRRGLAQEEKVWLSLTGGFDSRTLAAMAHHCGLSFKTYCHGQPDSSDVRIAAALSQQMGWAHEYFALPPDWGAQRPAWLARTVGATDAHLDSLKTSRIIREQTLKAQQRLVSLWGFGGELYRGYFWKHEFLQVGTTSKVDYSRLLDYRLLPALSWPVLQDAAAWVGTIRRTLLEQVTTLGEQRADWPNTVKLDWIGCSTGHAWDGAHISAALGMQRVLSPFDFKASASCVLSVNPKWRAHSRLFRLMLERLSPALAQMETSNGGPALPMRPTNLHKFAPYWLGLGQALAWRLGRKFLGRNLWRKRDLGKEGTAWPVAQWRRDTLAQLEDEAVLAPAEMYSASLYDIDSLRAFLALAQTDDFSHDELLGRIITVEMALRSVRASF